MKEYSAKEWLDELERENRIHGKYRDKAEKVVELYEDGANSVDEKNDLDRFNILWSNEEVMHSALYAKAPKPEVRRRYLDRDKAGKQAAELTERAISYALDSYDFDGTIDCSLTDYLIAGLGQVRMRYKPYIKEREGEANYLQVYSVEGGVGVFDGETQVDDYSYDDEGRPYLPGPMVEMVDYEEVVCEPVNWRRFRWQPTDRWENTEWAAIEHLKNETEIEEDYPDLVNKIPMGFTETGNKRDEGEDGKGYALIYEVFDRKNRKVYEIAHGCDEILKEHEDPLNLEGFYPFPKPLVSTLQNGKFIPIPDYHFYQDQARELSIITDRIHQMTAQLKYRGVYDGSFTELLQVESAEDGKFIPVADFSKIMNASGQADVSKVIAEVPTDGLIRALQQMYLAREQAKQTIYEITGIADIMRGSTKSDETLGAQQLKTQFGSMRMWKRQRKTAHFIRDIIRIKAEIMVENFSPETLESMTGMELESDIYNILKNDLMRSYRIDIETDSTIAQDESEEKRDRIELVKAVTEFIGTVSPMVEAGFLPQNVASELLGFAVRGFKIGRTLEDTLDEMGVDEDPRMRAMQGQFKRAQDEMQQQAAGRLQQIQQQAGKEIQGLQKKLFDAEKKLAVNGAVNQAKMLENRGKAEIETARDRYKTEMQMMLEVFRSEMRERQQEPYERTEQLAGALSEVMSALSMIDQRSQGAIERIAAQLEATQARTAIMEEYLQRPVKIERDERGRVTGATR